jgi:hypothetical protein
MQTSEYSGVRVVNRAHEVSPVAILGGWNHGLGFVGERAFRA